MFPKYIHSRGSRTTPPHILGTPQPHMESTWHHCANIEKHSTQEYSVLVWSTYQLHNPHNCLVRYNILVFNVNKLPSPLFTLYLYYRLRIKNGSSFKYLVSSHQQSDSIAAAFSNGKINWSLSVTYADKYTLGRRRLFITRWC